MTILPMVVSKMGVSRWNFVSVSSRSQDIYEAILQPTRLPVSVGTLPGAG